MLCDFIYLTPPIPWISTTQTLRSPPPLPSLFPSPLAGRPPSPSKPSPLTPILTSQPPTPTAKTPPSHAPSTRVFHSILSPLHPHPHSIPFHPPILLHPEPSTRGADCLSVGSMLTYCMGPSGYFPKKKKKESVFW